MTDLPAVTTVQWLEWPVGDRLFVQCSDCGDELGAGAETGCANCASAVDRVLVPERLRA